MSEELHFGRAAARLFITQPALSRQIQVLEQRLGVRLFARDGRTVRLSEAGRALTGDARAVVDAMERLRARAGQWSRTLTGHLVVGAVGAEAAMPYTRAILENLRSRHPRLTIEVRTLNFVDHMARLIDGDLDVAFLRPPVPPGIEFAELATEPRVACVSADDSLATRDAVSLSDLAGRPFVDMPPQIPRVWWDYWAVDPRPDGVPVRYGPVVSDMEGLLLAVARGEAVCLLPSAARDFFPRPGVRYLDVTDLSPCLSALGWLACQRDRPVIRAVREAVGASA
ncbi:LysR substrate-binding domain-containing protein [Streptosporangium oxazolinicum]|uniref:LysR substrate-binding domain-containing protein n=2 Tax=Streptosporangium oxazolinicum TaxID=909287 RepID=A0ABP8B1L3_9ACTN